MTMLRNFIEITARHECSPVNLLHSFRAPFPKNTAGRLLLLFIELLSSSSFFSPLNLEIYF